MYTHILSTCVHTKFHELIVYKTISEIVMLVHIPCDLDTILSHLILDVSVCAYWSPKYFNTLHGEHIQSEILLNVLKAWVILQKNLRLIIHVTCCGALSQEHGFTEIEIKVAIQFETWLQF